MIRLSLFALMLIGCASIQADTPLADMGMEVHIEPDGVTPPGTEGIVSLTITNYGPDIDSGFIRWTPTPNGEGIGYPPLDFTGSATGPCGISPIGQPPPGDNFGFLVTPDLQPLESVTCTYSFRVEETTLLTQIARWDVSVFGSGEDPNDANDADEVLFIFSPLADPRSVPALSWFGLFALILLLCLVSIRGVS